jgi:hypothetical protein
MIVGTWPTRLGQMIVDEGSSCPRAPRSSRSPTRASRDLKATASDRTKLQVGQQVTATLVGGTETAQGTISQLDDNATVKADTGEQSYEGRSSCKAISEQPTAPSSRSTW